MEKNDWSSFTHILCVRLDNMGDLVMTMPAIRALKQAVPGRRITLLTSTVARPLAAQYREIDEILVYDSPWIGSAVRWNSSSVSGLINTIKQKKFDAAVIFTVYSQSAHPSAFVCRMAAIPRILAYSRENPYHLITDWIPDREPLYEIGHEVTRQLDLVSQTGAKAESDDLFVPVCKAAAESALIKLKTLGVDIRQRWLLIHPGVSERRRQYPPQSFALVAKKLVAHGFQIILTGSEKEIPLLREVQSYGGKGVYSSGGLFDLHQLIGLLSKAPLLISNNTGVIHLAAAVKTPVIGIYAATNPQHYPWKTPQKLFIFDVPEPIRSKNVIIMFAYDKVYKNRLRKITPTDIVRQTLVLFSR